MSAPTVRAGGWIASLITALACLQPATASALELTELSLEELMAVELDAMEVTGIHHTHEKGEWMVGYYYMVMSMEGNLDGTHSVGVPEIFGRGFMVAPTEMTMQMHMLHVMYGVTDRLTLLFMMPFHQKSMDHVRMDGVRFRTDSSGLGDLELKALLSVVESPRHRLIAIAGLGMPTGSIDETDILPGAMGNPPGFARLPYPMQLGSGSWDVLVGATYIGQSPGWQWGAHIEGTLRTGRNDNQYRLGHAYEGIVWGARKLTDWSSVSLRLNWAQWFDVVGADPLLNPALVQTANPDLQAGRRLDLLAGVNVFSMGDRLSGLRLTLYGGAPVYQDLDGPQLETDWTLGFAAEWTF